MRKEQRIPKSKITEAIEALKALDKKELDDIPALLSYQKYASSICPLKGHAVLSSKF